MHTSTDTHSHALTYTHAHTQHTQHIYTHIHTHTHTHMYPYTHEAAMCTYLVLEENISSCCNKCSYNLQVALFNSNEECSPASVLSKRGRDDLTDA